MAKLRELQKEMTISLILDAADKLFHEKGFEGTRTADIAAEAGVSEGTLYNYFSSKSDMMMKMIEKKVYKEGNRFVANPAMDNCSSVALEVLELTNKQWGWASQVQRSHLRKVFSEFVEKPISENKLSQMVIKNDMVYRDTLKSILLEAGKHSEADCGLQSALIFDTVIISMQNFAIVDEMSADEAWQAFREKICYMLKCWNY